MAELRRPALTAESFTGITKAARDLGLGVRTLRQAVERGELPAYVFGQRARLKVSDVLAWIEAHRRRP
jgi:excisionase family DNA binding protein